MDWAPLLDVGSLVGDVSITANSDVAPNRKYQRAATPAGEFYQPPPFVKGGLLMQALSFGA